MINKWRRSWRWEFVAWVAIFVMGVAVAAEAGLFGREPKDSRIWEHRPAAGVLCIMVTSTIVGNELTTVSCVYTGDPHE